MMKQVFLIAAHKDPAQLNALVEQLRDDDFLIYVHLDAKGAISPGEVHPAARQVRERVAVHWGCFSQVQATLNSLKQIVAEVPDFDKVLFLSAQDFPLLSNPALKAALDGLRGQELLDTVAIGREPGQWAADYRYQYFYRDEGGKAARLACSLANRAMRAFGIRRRLPAGLRPWGGSSWWALSRDCVAALLERVRREPGLIRFFRGVSCPDEMFFQTLVMNSPLPAACCPRTSATSSGRSRARAIPRCSTSTTSSASPPRRPTSAARSTAGRVRRSCRGCWPCAASRVLLASAWAWCAHPTLESAPCRANRLPLRCRLPSSSATRCRRSAPTC
jgi:hypothetical protein